MKTVKRVILSLCIVAMLIGCIGGFAYADGDYTTYTIQGGDTVLAVCTKLGVDFYANEAWITAVNNITNYRDIKVGKVLYLPLFNTTKDPTKAMNLQNSLKGTTATATTATTPTTTATAATAATTATTTIASAAAAGDTVVSYLINHVLQAGETVGSVCAQLGVDFDSNADKIKQLSGITNYYHIPVGKTIVIPSLTAPAGSSVTAIIAHKVVGGETVGALCNKYGLDYAKVAAQLKALNSTDNLNRIRVGQTFYLPVQGTVTTATTSGTGTAAAATATTAATTPAVSMYSIAKQSSAHGTFTLQANNGAQLTTAAAGTNVKIVATPDSGYKVYTVTVMKTGGEQAVAVNNMSFVMPSYDVTVSVTFKSY